MAQFSMEIMRLTGSVPRGNQQACLQRRAKCLDRYSRLGKGDHCLIANPFDRQLTAKGLADHALEYLKHVNCNRVSINVRNSAKIGKAYESNGGRCAAASALASYRSPLPRCIRPSYFTSIRVLRGRWQGMLKGRLN